MQQSVNQGESHVVGNLTNGNHLVSTGIGSLTLEQHGSGSGHDLALLANLHSSDMVVTILTHLDFLYGVSTLNAAVERKQHGEINTHGGPVPTLSINDGLVGGFHAQVRGIHRCLVNGLNPPARRILIGAAGSHALTLVTEVAREGPSLNHGYSNGDVSVTVTLANDGLFNVHQQSRHQIGAHTLSIEARLR